MAERSGLETAANLAHYIKAIRDVIKGALAKGWIGAGVAVAKNFWHVLIPVIFVLVIVPVLIFYNIPTIAFDALASAYSSMDVTVLQMQMLMYYDAYWVDLEDYIVGIEEEFNSQYEAVVDGNNIYRYTLASVRDSSYMDVFWFAAIHTVYMKNEPPTREQILEFAKNTVIATVDDKITSTAGTQNTDIYFIDRTLIIEYASPYQLMAVLGFTEDEIQWAELLYSNIMGVDYESEQVLLEGVNLINPLPINWRNTVTSEFGPRVDPVNGGADYHTGIDLAAPAGTNIKAVMDGKVVSVVEGTTGYGYFVKIEHDNGIETLYAHCSKLLVEVDQEVKQGDVIAEVGTTGKSTGNHLHFEVRVNGKAINPRPYLP